MCNDSHSMIADVSGEVQVLQGRVCKTSRFLKLDPTCLLSLRKHSPLCEDLLSWQCFPLFAMPADLVAFLPYVNHFSSHFFIQHVSSMYASAQNSLQDSFPDQEL